MNILLRGLIHFYRWCIRPVLGNHCRFYPSCSQYALEAIELHGSTKGSWLALKRLLRCHPWHSGGIDMVPPAMVSPPSKNNPIGTIQDNR